MTSSSRLRRLLAGAPLVIALSGVAALPLPAAAQASCEAKIMSSGVTWGNALQTAVDEAPGGDTIQVRGSCFGPVVIAKNLTLVGKQSTLLGAPGPDRDPQSTPGRDGRFRSQHGSDHHGSHQPA